MSNEYTFKPREGVSLVDGCGMKFLRDSFDSPPDDLNFVLFSVSGVIGSYATIEDIETRNANPPADPEDDIGTEITFVLIRPRVRAMLYGLAKPTTAEDFSFLRQLRADSWAAIAGIGAN
jgi:hypothetical protein